MWTPGGLLLHTPGSRSTKCDNRAKLHTGEDLWFVLREAGLLPPLWVGAM